jgi:hypothetical protein
MSMSNTVVCPVSFITVNENRVRITAVFVLFASLSYLLAPGWVVPALLAVDFLLRACGKGRYSPFNLLSGGIVRLLKIANKPIDQAPKRFAAGIGFALTSILLAADLCALPVIALVVALVLALFSFLESALGFCAGCQVYSLVKRVSAILPKRASATPPR